MLSATVTSSSTSRKSAIPPSSGGFISGVEAISIPPGIRRVVLVASSSRRVSIRIMTEQETAEVLVVGAGPTGLFLALLLAAASASGVRIVDAAERPGHHVARACGSGAHARDLPASRPRGRRHPSRATPRRSPQPLAPRPLSPTRSRRAWRRGLQPVPLLASFFPQDEHERSLVERGSRREGVRARACTTIESSRRRTASGIVAQERRPDGSIATCEARYLAGCDGAVAGAPR